MISETQTYCPIDMKKPVRFTSVAMVALLSVSSLHGAESSVPPFSEDFADRAGALDKFTVIDANRDGNTWVVDSENHARVDFNSSKAMNDWMITPPLHLESGKKYPLSFTAACALTEFPEMLGVYMGTEPEAQAMKKILFEPFVVDSKGFVTYRTDIVVDSDGDYYIGFHGCSPADRATLFVDDIRVDAGATMSSPGAVTDFSAVADRSGGCSVAIGFNAPDTDLNGAPVESLESVWVERDGVEIKRFQNVSPGERFDFTDTGMDAGVHVWRVTASNADGVGLSAETSVFVGVNIPGAPLNLSLSEAAEDGRVILSWDAPVEDCLGYPLNTSDIRYNVYSPAGLLLMDGIRDTGVSFRAVGENDGQLLIYYYVTAVTDAGTPLFHEGARTDLKIVGTPTAMPFSESFAGQSASAVWHLSIPSGSGGQWQLTAVAPGAQDNDGGYAEFAPTQPGDSFTLLSEKIRLSAENPQLKFHYYAVECENVLNVSVMAVDGSAKVDARFALADGTGWSEADVDLRQLAGKTVQILYSYDAGYGMAGHLLLDNISVASGELHNLAISSVSVPEKMQIGSEHGISVVVRNTGMEAAEGYEVALYRDGEVAAVADGLPVAPFSSSEVRFVEVPTLFYSDAPLYSAEIRYTKDAAGDDNLSGEFSSMVIKPSYPVVSGLEASVADGGVALNWSAVDLSTAKPEAVTEDFESYESFTIDDLGEWTLVDRDGRGTYGFGIDNMPHGGDPFAYILVDNSNFSDDPNFVSRGPSSHKYLASVCCAGEQNDDWLISPMLSGDAQEVSLWARRRGTSASYRNESFEILYSTGSMEPDDFIPAGAFEAIPYEWTRYAVDLPEGAVYFAVRGTSADQMALFIDDVTYTPAALGQQLAVEGYNVYRDYQLLTSVPVNCTGYTDMSLTDTDNHIYHVTVVYDKGESRPSEGVRCGLSGVIANTLDTISVVPVQGGFAVSGSHGADIAVYGVDGRTVGVWPAGEDMYIRVAPGIYVVKVAGQTFKICVR